MKYGLAWKEFGKTGNVLNRQKDFNTEGEREKFIEKLEKKDGFWYIVAICK